MAKGDLAGAAPPQAPKTDQYSVMHKIMDALGGNTGAQNIAPSPGMTMPNPSMSMNGMNGGAGPAIAPAQGMPQMGGRFSSGPMLPRGADMNQPTVAPSNPQDMIRRNMIGSRTFGGV